MSHYTDHPKTWTKVAAEADLTITLPGGVPMYFRRIPGTAEAGLPKGFLMGSRGENGDEEPQHRVIIPHAFYMAAFSVTQAQWKAVAREAMKLRERLEPSHFKGPDHPVEQVSWYDCQDYCSWLTATWGGLEAKWKDKLSSEFKHPHASLPAEAWWEWACRGGTETKYWSGDGESVLAEVGWYEENSNNSTQPVGKLKPNGHGLYDMHGNVWEWCEDVYDENAYRKRVAGWKAQVWTEELAGIGEEEQNPHRVLRGGSWDFTAWGCHSAFRFGNGPVGRYGIFGFRVCLVPGPASKTAGGAEGAQGTGGGGRGTRLEPEVPDAPGAADPYKELKPPEGNPPLE